MGLCNLVVCIYICLAYVVVLVALSCCCFDCRLTLLIGVYLCCLFGCCLLICLC